MVEIPAQCVNPLCAYVDANASTGFSIGPGVWRFLSSSNHIAGGCPKCGSDMRVVEGDFSIAGNRLVLEAGPQWTRDVLRDLEDALSFAKSNFFTDPDEAVRRIEAASPSLAKAVLDAMSGRYAMGAYALIMLILTIVGTINGLIDDDSSSAGPQEAPTVITNVFQVQQSCQEPMSEEDIHAVVRDELQRLQRGQNHTG